MFDLTSNKSYKNLDGWYRDLREVCPDVPSVIAGNKVDNKKGCKVNAKQINFPRRKTLPYVNISVKLGLNFEKPFLFLAKKLADDNHIEFIERLAPRTFLETQSNEHKSDVTSAEGQLLLGNNASKPRKIGKKRTAKIDLAAARAMPLPKDDEEGL